MSKQLTSLEIAAYTMQAILNLPAGHLFQVMPEIIAGKIEEVRAENVPPGLHYRGKEKLANGTLRIHCIDGFFFMPYFQETGIAAIDALIALNDFSQMRLQLASKLINQKVQEMEKAKSAIHAG